MKESNKKLHVAVYCASSSAINPVFFEAAKELGILLAKQKATLVYGGGNVGLMAAVSNAALEAGGEVIGVLPYALQSRELGNGGVTELILTDGMRERKAIMEDRADAFITMPGGYGTLEEIFEILTGRQLSFHHKPMVLLNTAGFYDRLLAHLAYSVEQHFVKQAHLDLLYVAKTPQEAMDYINNYNIPDPIDKFAPEEIPDRQQAKDGEVPGTE